MAALVSLAGILTEQEEAFCMDIAMGVRYVDAFRQHFPEKLDTVKSVGASAYSKAQQPAIANRIRKLIEAREQEQLKSIKWSKEESIEKLRYVIATCQNEMERVHQAFEEELQFLQEQIEEEEDPRVIKSLVNKMIKLRQKNHLNKIQVTGIVDAVSELNTMHGFNENNVNVNSAVSFVGEEDLED